MTIPNMLTLSRIFLTPLLVWFLLDNRTKEALYVFLIAGSTDGLDGLIARLFHQKSKLGAYLDPLADKLLLVSSFLLLGRLGFVPSWLVIITVSRDTIILLGIIMLMFHQVQIEIRPSVLSKTTTLMQLATVLTVLIVNAYAISVPPLAEGMLFVMTALLSIVSGFHYMLIGLSLMDVHWFHNGKARGKPL